LFCGKTEPQSFLAEFPGVLCQLIYQVSELRLEFPPILSFEDLGHHLQILYVEDPFKLIRLISLTEEALKSKHMEHVAIIFQKPLFRELKQVFYLT
jgi:hypothetical protein